MNDKEEYNKLFEEVRKFRYTEPVETTSEEISVYELIRILNKKFLGLSNFVNRIRNKDFVIKKFLSKQSIVDISLFNFKKNNNSFVLKILNGRKEEKVRVKKHNDKISYVILTNGKKSDIIDLIKLIEKEINDLFDEMDRLGDLFDDSNSKKVSLSNNLFKCDLVYYTDGSVFLTPLKINSHISGSYVANKAWRDRPVLNEVVASYHDELIKRVAIKVSDLPANIQNIIGEYLENKNSQALTKNIN